MRISKTTIHNFRSIAHLEMRCEPLVVMLGPNNHGKSNILAALEFALSTSAKPEPTDLFRCCGDDKELWVEVTFDGLSGQEATTFKRHLQPDGTFTARKIVRFGDDGRVEIQLLGWEQVPGVDFLRPEKVAELAKREAIDGTPLRDLVPPTGRITQAQVGDAQQQYIEAHRLELTFETVLGAFLGEKNIGGGLLPDFYLLPAVRELSDETKVKSTTMFGRLLNRAVQEMALRDERFQVLRQQLKALVDTLNRPETGEDARPQQLKALEKTLEDELTPWGVKVAIEFEPPEIEKVFELGTNLNLDDGVATSAERKGHGLQRAVIFGLMRAWARALRQPPQPGEAPSPRKASESLIFGFEEPELFLHPQAQRRLHASLVDIANTAHHQVFLCSHSSHFVDLDRYRSICIVSRKNIESGTTVRQTTQELFGGPHLDDRKKRFHMARWVNPDRAEMFFARKVVLVEGETEAAVLPFLAQVLGCYDPEVSIVDCGSKFNLELYITIANAFKLRYFVVHDEDPLPDPMPATWNYDRIKAAKRTLAENAEILGAVDKNLGSVRVLEPDFEEVAGVSKSQGDRKGKALAALDHLGALGSGHIPAAIEKVVRAAYAV